MTHDIQPMTDQTLIGINSAQSMTRQLEQLWLLSALGVGFDQIARGELVRADTDFFDTMQARLFQQEPERIIEA